MDIQGYVYSGDLDVCEGGKWIGVEGDATGHVIEVISPSDWDGGFLISSRVAITWHPLADLRRALGSGCGWRGGNTRAMRRAGIIAAYVEYGYADPANEYPNHSDIELPEDAPESAVIEAVESYAR